MADPPAGSGDGWQVIPELTDEFDGATLDSNKWWDYNPGWLGRQPGYFWPNNVSVSDGKLHLTARVESLPNLPSGYHTYTTAAVKGKTLVKYGYFEIRCRPMKSKASSAFWFYQQTAQEWTEIDVFEICGAGGSWNNSYNMNVHHFYSPASSSYFQNSRRWNPPFVMADEYHVYAVEWTKDVIRWWVDGTVQREIKNTHWHQPLHMNFDSETFPDWFGLPDPTTLPSTFSIDYVRSWSSPTQVAWTAASQFSFNESGTMTVTAQLSNVSGEDVTVPFTVGGSASGADYTITPSSITIPAGQTTATITITITEDLVVEPDETVILTMAPPINATKGEITVHTATITGVANGSWTYNGTDATSNTWTTAGSWSGGTIASGANFTANFTLDITGARTITLGGDRTIGNILFTDTTSSHNLTISGNTLILDVTTGAPTIDVTQSGRTLTINSIIAGNDGLTKTGLGTLAISGSNTYTGATTVSQGTLNVLDDTNGLKNSTSLSIATGATVNATGAGSLYNGNWTIAGTLNKTDGTGQWFWNPVTLNNGTISGTTDPGVATGYGTYSWAGTTITANGSANTITAARLGFGNANTVNTPLLTDALNISSIIGVTTSGYASVGTLTKNGLGTLTLTGFNRYTGNTTVNGGTLKVTGTGRLYREAFNSSAVVTVQTGGVLELDTWSYGTSESLGQLALQAARIVINNGTIRMNGTTGYGRGVTVQSGGATFEAAAGANWTHGGVDPIAYVYTGNPSLTFTGAGTGTFAKVFSGLGSLTKSGVGTWTLTGTNSYTGATMVNAGKLLINGSTASGSAVTVSGGDLGGTGTIGGNVTVAAAGNLAPGVTAGTLNITGNLDISAMAAGAGTLKIDLDTRVGTNDRIVVGGSLALGSLALDDLAITNLGGLEAGTYTLITSTGLTGTVNGGTALIATGFNGKLQPNGNNLELVVTAVVTSPYSIWAGSGVAFDTDTNDDGVDNGMAWVLGATNPSENALHKLPTPTHNGTHLRLTFRCLKSTHRGGVVLKVQSSDDMGLTDPWTNHEAAVPDVDSTVNGVFFDTTDDGDYIHVIADIPAAGSKLFARLSAVNAP